MTTTTTTTTTTMNETACRRQRNTLPHAVCASQTPRTDRRTQSESTFSVAVSIGIVSFLSSSRVKGARTGACLKGRLL